MSAEKDNNFIRVNKTLTARTAIAGVPADQLVPWTIFLFIAAGLWNSGVAWQFVIPLLFWVCGTWWLLMGESSWKYLNRFSKPPKWVSASLRYKPILHQKSKDDNNTDKR